VLTVAHSDALAERLQPAWDLTATWPAKDTAIAVMHQDHVATRGDVDRVFHLASVTKLLTAWTVHIACEEGSVRLTDAVGQDGCTVEHLLAHAGGYAFDGDQPIASPASRRIYSNTGYELLAHHVEQHTGIDFATYMHEAICEPLGMTETTLRGSAAKDGWSNVRDLISFVSEMRRPQLISRDTYIHAVTTAFPDLAGIVPGFGKCDPSPWGLGPEIKGLKDPQWTAPHGATSTFGHFGSAGTFVWVDPVANVAVILLSNTPFDDWGPQFWAPFNQTVLDCCA
jgi:CubicO group peptidase (beta-lactamase class C family)